MNKTRLFPLLLITSVLLATCNPGPAPQVFQSEQGNFSAQVPAGLTLAESSLPVNQLTIHSFDGRLGETGYGIFYYDLPGEATDQKSQTAALDGARDGWLQFMHGRLESEQQITLGKFPGREITVAAQADSGALTIKARYYLVRSRIYQITVSVPADHSIGLQADTFLKSFALLQADGAPQAAASPTAGPDHTGSNAIGPLPTKGFLQIRSRNIVNTGGGFVRMSVDPLSKQIYYMDNSVDIYRLALQPGAASTGWKVYSAADVGELSTSLGMIFGPDGSLYVLGNEAAGDTTRAIVRKGVADASGKRQWSTLVSTAPYALSKSQFDHVYGGLAVSPDGQYLFIAAGSRSDHGEVETGQGAFPDTRELPLTSAILRVPTDAQDLLLPDDEDALKPYLFADGFRNAFDMAFDAHGELFAIDNGPDADYPDELNWVREGGHYGFPWRFGKQDNPQRSPTFDPKKNPLVPKDSSTYTNDPAFPTPPAGLQFIDPVANFGPDAASFRDELDGQIHKAPDAGQAVYSFTPHRSPLGLVFDTQDSLPGQFKGQALILSWGAALGDFQDKGQDLLDLQLVKKGDHYEMTATQIMTGFKNPIDAVLLDGKLYVLEYGGNGGIWEITFPEK